MALLLVIVGSLVVAKIAMPDMPEMDLGDEPRQGTWRELFLSYGGSLVYIFLRTVPLVVVGIWASMWLMARFPRMDAAPSSHVLGIAFIALIAVFLTLPSLFEIPMALSILAAGGPVGGAAAILFAGPAVNLPSLFVIGRHSNWKVAVFLAAAVWIIALTGGLLLS